MVRSHGALIAATVKMSLSQSADGVRSRQGSAGQRVPTCCQTGGQEAEGVRCGEKSQCCNHVSGHFIDALCPDIQRQIHGYTVNSVEQTAGNLRTFKPVWLMLPCVEWSLDTLNADVHVSVHKHF